MALVPDEGSVEELAAAGLDRAFHDGVLTRHLASADESCPLLLDDVTVQSDGDRTLALRDLLHELSAHQQVILFAQERLVADCARQTLTGPADSVIAFHRSPCSSTPQIQPRRQTPPDQASHCVMCARAAAVEQLELQHPGGERPCGLSRCRGSAPGFGGSSPSSLPVGWKIQ